MLIPFQAAPEWIELQKRSWSHLKAFEKILQMRRDVSTGPLACLFALFLTLLNNSLAPHCSLCSRTLLRSFIHSLPSLWESKRLIFQNQAVLNHSGASPTNYPYRKKGRWLLQVCDTVLLSEMFKLIFCVIGSNAATRTTRQMSILLRLTKKQKTKSSLEFLFTFKIGIILC